MNRETNIATHLSIGTNVNGQQKLTGFVEFVTSNWWMISVDMLVIISALWKDAFDLG